MDEIPDLPKVSDAVKAAAFMSDQPVDQVHGYILIVVNPEGEKLITSNYCCRPHVNAILADTVANTTMDLASHTEVLITT